MSEWEIGRHVYTIPDDISDQEKDQLFQAIAAEEAANPAQEEDDLDQGFGEKFVAPDDTTWGDRTSRGLDQLQGTFGRTYQAFGELIGSEGMEEAGRSYAERQAQEAEVSAPAPDNFLDLVQESIPALGAIAGATATGAAVGSVVPGIGTVAGGLTMGLLASFGMNVGDVKEIQEMIAKSKGEESDFGATQLAIATAATLPDIVFGKIATEPLKRSAVSQAKEAIKTQAKKKLLKKVGVEVAKDTAVGAGAAGLSAGILVAGTAAGEGGVDQVVEMADAIGETISNAVMLGGPLAATMSGGSHTPELIRLAKDPGIDGAHLAENGAVEFTEVNPLFAQHLEDFTKPTADFISKVAGKATDPFMRTYGDNPYVREFVGDIVQRPELREERVRKTGTKNAFGEEYDPSTASNWRERLQADANQEAGYADLRKLSKKDLDAIELDVARGNFSNPAAAKVRNFWRKYITEAKNAGKDVGDLGDTYLPFFADRGKFTTALGRKDPTKIRAFVEGAINDRVARGSLDIADTAAVAKARGRYTRYVEDVYAGGVSRLSDEFRITPKMLETISEAEAGDPTALKKLGDPLVSRNDVEMRRSNLDTHRELSELSQEFLNAWGKDMSLLDKMDNYANLAGISIGAAKKFGPNGEKLARNLRLAVAEGIRTGNRISNVDLERMVEVANVSQLLPTGNRTPEERAMWRSARGVSTFVNLQGATVSSLAEPYFLVPKVGGKATVTGLGKALVTSAESVARSVSSKIAAMPRGERMELVEELNLSHRQGLSSAASKIGEDALGISTLEHATVKYNGLASWTAFTKLWGAYAIEARIKSLGQALVDDMSPDTPSMSPNKRARIEKQLYEAGLDPKRVRMWVQDGAKREDYYFKNFVRDGIRNVTRDVFILPEQVDLPLWTADPRMVIFSNLKSFALAFNNTIGREWIRTLVKAGQNPRQAFITASTIGIAVPSFILLDAIKAASNNSLEEWQDKEPAAKIVGGLSRMGGGGLIVDPLMAQQWGKTPLESTLSPVFRVVETPITGIQSIYRTLNGDQEPEELLSDVVNTMTRTTPFVGTPIQEAFEP